MNLCNKFIKSIIKLLLWTNKKMNCKLKTLHEFSEFFWLIYNISINKRYQIGVRVRITKQTKKD